MNKYLFFKTNVGLTVIVLLLIAIISTLVLLDKVWQAPILVLFASSNSLTLSEMALQLQLLPTMLVAILSGGLLGLCSILLQQLVKNNLASDTTLAVGSGSQMALLLVTLFLPNLGLYGSFWVAFVGALLSMGLVFFLAKNSHMNPVVLVLSGLIVNILLSALAGVLLLFYSEMSMGVIVWGSGALNQSSFLPSYDLLSVSGLFLLLLCMIYRPLVLMSLDDRQAKSLGVPVNMVRCLLIGSVAMAIAVVISHVGQIGFIGLASATLVNVLNVSKLYARFLLSFVIGGLLLWITANISGLLNAFLAINLPAGAMTALLGTPLIIYIILKNKHQISDNQQQIQTRQKQVKFSPFIGAFVVLTVLALCFAPQFTMDNVVLSFGFIQAEQLSLLVDFRLPRTLGAMAVGAMLAISGVLLQTLTKNPMASPEVLGIGSGVALGAVLAFMLLPMIGITPLLWHLVGFGVLGAGIVLALVLWLAKRVPASHLLLVGVAISALMSGVLNVIKLIGDPRLQAVLGFLSGSTYHLNLAMAIGLSVFAVLGLVVSYLLIKPLNLMGFGKTIATGRGVSYQKFELAILLLIAFLSVFATLAVGPLSFVGLMIPHLASSLGANNLSQKLPLSALLGAMLMLVADWVGRYAMFPYEIPAGTICAMIGGGYFMYLMRKISH